jgi:c-di-GMP-binding flagellar brake protein YcgR
LPASALPAIKIKETAVEPNEAAEQSTGRKERRRHPRLKLNSVATLYPINAGAKVNAQILDLSLGGCRLRLERRIPLDIRIRVEVGFYYEGLPFRVGGVIQSVHTQEEIGIRFVDLSPRNLHRLQSLIEEIQTDAQRSEGQEESLRD